MAIAMMSGVHVCMAEEVDVGAASSPRGPNVKLMAPTVEKTVLRDGMWVNATDAAVGEILEFRLVGTLPTGAVVKGASCPYAFVDDLPSAMDVDLASVRVVHAQAMEAGHDVTAHFDVNLEDGVLSVSCNDLCELGALEPDDTIVVTYGATMGTSAKTGMLIGNVNSARIAYKVVVSSQSDGGEPGGSEESGDPDGAGDPDGSGSHGGVPSSGRSSGSEDGADGESEYAADGDTDVHRWNMSERDDAVAYTYRVVINKYDVSTGVPLAGATFALDDATETTDTDGRATFNGVGRGVVNVEETSAPAGYAPVSPFQIEIVPDIENSTVTAKLTSSDVGACIALGDVDAKTGTIVVRVGNEAVGGGEGAGGRQASSGSGVGAAGAGGGAGAAGASHAAGTVAASRMPMPTTGDATLAVVPAILACLGVALLVIRKRFW
ncbi:MAG: isopeptide-forming domain-containing fimbrial protein [Atopobiaceae bacterium]|nr:isopeptide-forming domain-containing fimbrial protein [Atopobiaceae bacterium]